jgi:hypothetical protein
MINGLCSFWSSSSPSAQPDTKTDQDSPNPPGGYRVRIQVFNRIGDPAHETIAIPSQLLTYTTMPTHSTIIGDINSSVREHLEYCADKHTIAQPE